MIHIRKNGSIHQTSGILCPQCGTNSSRVVDSREIPGTIKRRRECVRCGGRWNTYETMPGFQHGSKNRGR
jgi:ribosomal protein S27AE